MIEMYAIVAVSAAAFIATNLDNLLLLMAFHSRYSGRASAVTRGYLAGMVLIGVICLLMGEAGELIPTEYLGLLGVIPIVIGCKALIGLARQRQAASAAAVGAGNSFQSVFVTVMMTQLSNGADSIITFSVLLAESSDSADYLIIPVFLGMASLFAWVAFYSIKHRNISNFIDRFGHFVTPFILILVGAYILANTATDLVPG